MLSKLGPPPPQKARVVLRPSVRRWLDKNLLIYGSGHTWQLIYISMRGPPSDINTKALPRLLATTLFACAVSNCIAWQMQNEAPTTSIDPKLVFPPGSCINPHGSTLHKITGTFQINKCRIVAGRAAPPAAFNAPHQHQHLHSRNGLFSRSVRVPTWTHLQF